MQTSLKDAAHLIRLAVVVVVAVIGFLILRSVLVPPGFGQYGHFRPGALDDNRARPLTYAGHAACELCHEEVLNVKKTGKHAGVACEACHGPQGKHADDSSIKPVLPDTAVLCARCHEANSAKPRSFPQVVTKEHSNGMACGGCHKPHKPKIGA